MLSPDNPSRISLGLILHGPDCRPVYSFAGVIQVGHQVVDGIPPVAFNVRVGTPHVVRLEA